MSAPPGARVDVSEGLTELDTELQSWRHKGLRLRSHSWVLPAVPYALSSLCSPSKVNCLSFFLLLAAHFTCPSVSCRYSGLLLLARDSVL